MMTLPGRSNPSRDCRRAPDCICFHSLPQAGQAVKLLVCAFSDENTRVKSIVIWALRKKESECHAELVKALHPPDERPRNGALEALSGSSDGISGTAAIAARILRNDRRSGRPVRARRHGPPHRKDRKPLRGLGDVSRQDQGTRGHPFAWNRSRDRATRKYAPPPSAPSGRRIPGRGLKRGCFTLLKRFAPRTVQGQALVNGSRRLVAYW